METKIIGETAYNGYRDSTGGKTWNGYDMPLWPDLTDAVRAAWEASAVAVRSSVLHGVVNMMQAAIAEEEAEKVARK